VVDKNKDNINFNTPLQVFVKMKQNPPSDSNLVGVNEQTRDLFERLRARYLKLKSSYQNQQDQKKLSRLELKKYVSILNLWTTPLIHI
jgi:hypothetical protein